MLTIQPPFGYRALKPLNRSDHVRLLKPGELPPFARDSQIVPLSYAEIVVAAWHYPIVFLHNLQSNDYTVAAMLGLAPNHNAFGGGTGWDASTYVPAYIRRYPFCMATITANAKPESDWMVCIEADHASAVPAEGTEQLFDAEGHPGARWNVIENFLKDYEADLAASRAFTQRLVELDLLEPFTANIVRPGDAGQFTVGGMVRVNEARLAALDAQAVASLHRSGYLGRIYVHLFSLQRFQWLLERETQQGAYEASQTSPLHGADESSSTVPLPDVSDARATT